MLLLMTTTKELLLEPSPRLCSNFALQVPLECSLRICARKVGLKKQEAVVRNFAFPKYNVFSR